MPFTPLSSLSLPRLLRKLFRSTFRRYYIQVPDSNASHYQLFRKHPLFSTWQPQATFPTLRTTLASLPLKSDLTVSTQPPK